MLAGIVVVRLVAIRALQGARLWFAALGCAVQQTTDHGHALLAIFHLVHCVLSKSRDAIAITRL